MAVQTKTFTGADGTLFHIAARLYSDPLQWYRIAAANGITDPVITGVVELKIPPRDPSPSAGIPPQ